MIRRWKSFTPGMFTAKKSSPISIDTDVKLFPVTGGDTDSIYSSISSCPKIFDHNGNTNGAINNNNPPSVGLTNVNRSQSFSGMSTNARLSMLETPPTPILGQTLRTGAYKPPPATPSKLGLLSTKKTQKIPKVPRPPRASLMFISLKKGIGELIQVTKDDIRQIQESTDFTDTKSQTKILAADKQIKSAERYLKRLEFHLSKIEELHDIYALHEQLREGAKTMVHAYTINPSRTKDSLTNVRCGYKECTQTMCTIEAQLESMMGTFHCRLKGMVGFARLCAGDIFEVIFRYGSQKWKTKGKIEKDGSQKWDSTENTFKALIGDVINIKAIEQRSFKSLVLGLKNCETKDLFSPNPQMMTVSVNTNGSLKFSVIVTWNPFDGVDESSTIFDPAMNPTLMPRKRPVSLLNLNTHNEYSLQTSVNTTENRKSSPITQDSNDNQKNKSNNLKQKNSSIENLTTATTPAKNPPSRPPRPARDGITPLAYTKRNATPVKSALRKNVPQTEIAPQKIDLPQMRMTGAILQNASHNQEDASNLEEALASLMTTLEDFHGQYVEIMKLEEMTQIVERMFRRSNSRSSSVSISVESALGAFDFLNIEDIDFENRHAEETMDHFLVSPQSTAKTADSGIESLTKRLSEDTQFGSSLGSTPEPASTGNEQVDQALMTHFIYCEKLLQSLGSYGPLRCRELYSLHKLEKQADMIENMIKVAQVGPTLDLYSVLNDITRDKQLREFWTKCVEHQVLFVHPERLAAMLDQKMGSSVRDKYDVSPLKVFRQLISNIMDLATFDLDEPPPTAVITLYQFIGYLDEEGGLQSVDALAADVWLCDRLLHKDTSCVVKTLHNLHKQVTSASCLKVIVTLLHSEKGDIRETSKKYMLSLAEQEVFKEKCTVVLVEALEDKGANVRSGACAALALLKVSSCIDRLVYLCQTDSSQNVRCQAKEALHALGDDGRRAYTDSQLATHGFQGVQMMKKADWLR